MHSDKLVDGLVVVVNELTRYEYSVQEPENMKERSTLFIYMDYLGIWSQEKATTSDTSDGRTSWSKVVTLLRVTLLLLASM